MNFGYIDGSVVCPYYGKVKIINKRRCIVCESIIGTQAINTFDTNDEFNLYVRKFCLKNWSSCKHARAVSEKYET